MSASPLHGLLAEFVGADALASAVARARAEQYTSIEAYSPFPIEGLAEMLGPADTRVRIAQWMLLGAILGGAGTFGLEWYSAVIDYPIIVGGRPANSWQAFLPAAIEMTVLWAVLFGVAAMLLGNGLPRLHHPLFAVPAFERASSDRFFLLVRGDDARFDSERTRAFLDTLSPVAVSEVPGVSEVPQ